MNLSDPSAHGLTTSEARERLARFGRNQIQPGRRSAPLFLFLAQFKSPIILILIGAAIVSLFLQAHTDATLIITIIVASGLLNLLTDLPEMTIASDSVDPELISSVFDYLTFGVLIWLNATVQQFRTGWFIESIASAALIVLVVRSRRPFFKSRPSKLLTLATADVVIAAMVTPHLPFAAALGLGAMPAYFYPLIALIILAYVAAAEWAKLAFYRKTAP